MLKQTKSNIILGFDFGKKFIGVATGQTLTGTSSSLTIILAKQGIPNWDEVGAIIDEWKPDTLVVGLPLNIDATESDLSILARDFARALHARFKIQVQMMDERLSSREARDISSNLGASERKKLDHIAAALILQSWLDNPQLGHQP